MRGDDPRTAFKAERKKALIRLAEITEENWYDVACLSVKDSQKEFLAPPIGIIARGYVYRDCRAKVYAIENDGVPVGVALVREFTDEPLGYDLQQFMIDARYQRRGYGSAALGLILDELRKVTIKSRVALRKRTPRRSVFTKSAGSLIRGTSTRTLPIR